MCTARQRRLVGLSCRRRLRQTPVPFEVIGTNTAAKIRENHHELHGHTALTARLSIWFYSGRACGACEVPMKCFPLLPSGTFQVGTGVAAERGLLLKGADVLETARKARLVYALF